MLSQHVAMVVTFTACTALVFMHLGKRMDLLASTRARFLPEKQTQNIKATTFLPVVKDEKQRRSRGEHMVMLGLASY